MGIKLATSTYSFHRLGMGPEGGEPPPLERMIERCADLGLDGIEILGRHIAGTTPPDLHAIKGLAARRGIAIVAVSAHHNFVTPDPDRRLEQIDILAGWIDVAQQLGAPFVRAFGGRWGTAPSFAAFMAAGGAEAPLAGHTDDDAYAWSAEAFKIAGYYAGRRGVTLALENHWGLTGTADGVLRILRETGSPWLRVVLDLGNFNFAADQYAEMAKLLPHTALVHAKTYTGGGLFYTADLDYPRIGRMLKDADYRGYVSIEFEGKATPEEGLRESVALLREALA